MQHKMGAGQQFQNHVSRPPERVDGEMPGTGAAAPKRTRASVAGLQQEGRINVRDLFAFFSPGVESDQPESTAAPQRL